jgi:MFS family permease
VTDQLTPPTTVTPTPPARLGVPALLTVLSGAFLPMLTFFIVNVALPAIGDGLRASASSLQLVVGSYGIAVAALVVVGGRLGDGYGRRRLFLLGLAGFAVTSLLCALAPTVGVLLAARVAQGAAAALMTPQVLATIAATLTGPHRARALGLFGASGGLAAALGQVLGGWLGSADLFGTGWRAVFLLNVPIAALALLAAWRLVPETRATHRLPVDAVGAGWLGLTLVVLLLPLTEGRVLGWPLWTWLLLGAAVPLAAGLLAHQTRLERRGHVPLTPPSVLRLRGMRIGLAIGALFFTTFVGFMFAFSLAVQGVGGLSAFQAGLSILPMAVGFLYASIVGPRLGTRWGTGIITRGAVIQAAGYLALAGMTRLVWPEPTPLALAVPMTVVGIGSGFVMMPLFGVVLAQVPVQQAGLGSGILITMQQACLALGVATVGTAYLALAETGWGVGGALVAVELLVAVVSIGIAGLGRRLRPAGGGGGQPG